MTQRLSYTWRIAGTLLAFGVFFVGLVVIQVLLLPVLLVPGITERDLKSQRIIHQAAKLFMYLLEGWGLIRIRVEGAEQVSFHQPQVIVANHPTLIDVLLLLSVLPRASCVVKEPLRRSRLFRGIIDQAGYISNDSSYRFIDTCINRLIKGSSLIIFPEGTRSPAEGLRPFKGGAAAIALRSGSSILPVVIKCDPLTLGKGQKWYLIPGRPVDFTVRFENAISARSLPEGSARSDRLLGRKLTVHLQQFYQSRVVHEY